MEKSCLHLEVPQIIYYHIPILLGPDSPLVPLEYPCQFQSTNSEILQLYIINLF